VDFPAGVRDTGRRTARASRARTISARKTVERGPVLHGQGQVVDARTEPVVRLVRRGRASVPGTRRCHPRAPTTRTPGGSRRPSPSRARPAAIPPHRRSLGPGRSPHRSRWCSARNMALILDSGGRPVCSVESSPAAARPPPGRRVSPRLTAPGFARSAAGSGRVGALGEQEVTGRRVGGRQK
jgi:hypothetical protein